MGYVNFSYIDIFFVVGTCIIHSNSPYYFSKFEGNKWSFESVETSPMEIQGKFIIGMIDNISNGILMGCKSETIIKIFENQ